MDAVMLTWSFRNVLTIALMGFLVYMLLGLGAQLWQNRQGA